MGFVLGIRENHLLQESLDVGCMTLQQSHDRFDLLQDFLCALEHTASIVRSTGDERQPVALCLVLEGFYTFHTQFSVLFMPAHTLQSRHSLLGSLGPV
jgi:hypothetical protein